MNQKLFSSSSEETKQWLFSPPLRNDNISFAIPRNRNNIYFIYYDKREWQEFSDHAQKVSMESQVDVQNFEHGFTQWKPVIEKPKLKASKKLDSKPSKQTYGCV